MTFSVHDIGIPNNDARLIDRLVELFPEKSFELLTADMRKAGLSVCSEHLIYLGVTYGRKLAALELQANTINLFTTCRLN